MKTLSIDIETFSSVDLAKTGVYKYAESPDFEILLFGYSVDGGDVRVVDLTAGETIPANGGRLSRAQTRQQPDQLVWRRQQSGYRTELAIFVMKKGFHERCRCAILFS